MPKVKYFAVFKEKTKKREENIKGGTIKEILNEIADQYGDEMRKLIFDERGNLRDYVTILLNSKIVKIDEIDKKIGENDEIAIFPPVSGGFL
ncbi:MAG: ubiquitin-like small modifier protein 1 [Candidatus Hydrothermarchaeota archaeon]